MKNIYIIYSVQGAVLQIVEAVNKFQDLCQMMVEVSREVIALIERVLDGN